MDHNPRYADGSVVHAGDIVELDRTAAIQSYAGYVGDMDSLIGLKLLVKKTGSVRVYKGNEIAILHLEAFNDQSAQRVLDQWIYSSDMFVISSCNDDIDATELDSFIENQ